jgi:succinylglutamate desuccinylase
MLGRKSGDGPTLVALAGIHGNETAGVRAAERVLAWLERERPPLYGEIVFLAGNLPALQRNSRFIDLDLNRQWTPDKLAAVVAAEQRADEPVEHGQQRELLATLRGVVESAHGQLYFVDLHSSSADGPPFVTIGDTLRNRQFAQELPLPLILGLEEQVDGALLELLNNRGFITMGVEAGLHDAPASIDRHEAVLWLTIVAAGILREEHAPDLAPLRELLREASRGVPPVIEVHHRHVISNGDEFRMQPGYLNFQRVNEGELLAHDRQGPIHSPADGLILLPLYQGQGDDGFFVSREVASFWLRVSALLRRSRLNRLMRFLPGVRRDPNNPEVLIVDTRVVRVYPLEIFHLSGFRKVRQNGSVLTVTRRRYDLDPPRQISFN